MGPRAVLDSSENLAPPGFDPRTVQLVTIRYTDGAILAPQLFCVILIFLNFVTLENEISKFPEDGAEAPQIVGAFVI
jgi:hypothetical protein